MKASSRDGVERKYKRTRREKDEKRDWRKHRATEDWRDVGTLEMRRRRRSGQMRWEVNSVGHVRGLENGKS